ncbi:MAG: hypothetical protein II180_07270 [Proteobacteria bacterium]|nr:hypothetical protein [Pseudomonadota bacterium]
MDHANCESCTFSVSHTHYCGDGMAESPDCRMFRIANALAGECVEAVPCAIMRRRQAYLLRVISPSPDRIAPSCPNWQACPACQYACLSVEAQRALKKAQWLRLIQKFIEIPEGCPVDFICAPQTLGYRHRTDLTVFETPKGRITGILPRTDAAAVAYFKALPDQDPANVSAQDIYDSGVVMPLDMQSCALHAPELSDLIARFCALNLPFAHQTKIGFEAYQDQSRLIFYAMPQEGRSTKALALEAAQALGVSAIFQELPPRGSHVYPKPETLAGDAYYGYAHDDESHLLYALRGAWTPVNPQNAAMIRQVLSEMTEHRHFASLLELGCGCGTHTSVMKRCAQVYTGIDASWPAILSAQHNAQRYDWQNVAFFTDTAEHYLDKRYYKGCRAEAILMHSNRMPYSEKTAALCKRFGTKTLYIVAPTAYAVAQECRHFLSLGYRLTRLVLCDTLPMTYHMMAVASLEL